MNKNVGINRYKLVHVCTGTWEVIPVTLITVPLWDVSEQCPLILAFSCKQVQGDYPGVFLSEALFCMNAVQFYSLFPRPPLDLPAFM